jgi:hypothetical protein
VTIGTVLRSLRYLPIYGLCILLAGLLWKSPVLLTACYLVLTASMLAKWHTPADVVFFFLSFTLGPLGEIVAVSLGAWQYANSSFFIPMWLPFAWGISGLFLKKTVEVLVASPQSSVAQEDQPVEWSRGVTHG